MSLFFSMAFLVATIGKAVPFLIVLAFFAILTLGNTMAEFSKKIPSSGSFITFIANTFGVKFATASALTLVVGYIIAISGVIAVLGGWISTMLQRYINLNTSWLLFMIIGSVIITFLTIRGVKVSARSAIIFFAFEALILIILSLVIIGTGGDSGLSLAPFNPANVTDGMKGLALGFPLVVFLFVG